MRRLFQVITSILFSSIILSCLIGGIMWLDSILSKGQSPLLDLLAILLSIAEGAIFAMLWVMVVDRDTETYL